MKAMECGIVYGAMHDSGLWYIGSTRGSLQYRRHCHYAKALNPREQHSKFHQALASTGETEWTWGVHESFERINNFDLRSQEAAYQRAFDSTGDKGYNSMEATKDPAKEKSRQKAWYTANRDAQLEKGRKWHAKNREENNARRSAAYYSDKENILKEKKAMIDADRDAWNARRRAAYRKKKSLNPPVPLNTLTASP